MLVRLNRKVDRSQFSRLETENCFSVVIVEISRSFGQVRRRCLITKEQMLADDLWRTSRNEEFHTVGSTLTKQAFWCKVEHDSTSILEAMKILNPTNTQALHAQDVHSSF